MDAFDKVGEVEILIYTNIQEYNSDDTDKVELWQETVEEFLWGIPDISEIGVYGFYYFKIKCSDISELDKKIEIVKEKLNEWEPPFEV